MIKPTNILDGFSILYVEDETDVREQLAQFLKRRVSKLYLACNGLEGLESFKKYRPDIVITDILMPELDGLNMAKAIKTIHPETPIIVTTASNEADLFLKAVEIGIEKYVLKPLQSQKLLVTLQETAWLLKVVKDLKLSATVFNSASEAILVTDPENIIVAVNPAFTKITGYRDDEILGKNPKMLSSGRQDKAFYQAMWNSILNNDHWEGEIWNRRKDGEFYIEWLTINVVRNKQNDIIYYVALFNDITKRKQTEQHLYHLAHYDALTELPNRILLQDRLEQSLIQARRNTGIICVLFIDLDRFKLVNDTLGHPVGDLLLQEVTQRLQCCVRETDTVARLGGDEFVILLTQMKHGEDAALVARKIIHDLAAPFFIGNTELNIGCSIGISVYPHNGETAELLMRHADVAMYRVKEAGRNDYQFFHEDMNVRLLERLAMENNLRNALAQNEFELYYQPVINLQTETVITVEALLRWNHPVFGIVFPDKFLPLAEECGLMSAIGEWVFKTAITQIKSLHAFGFSELRVAINISTQQLQIPGLIRQLKLILNEYDYSPELLEIEIKESTLLYYNAEILETLKQLKALGVSIVIDNFGAGYSSLKHLKALPISGLKIDRSFLKSVEHSETDAALIAAIIAMARTLSLNVTAEGLETAEELELAKQHIPIHIQGFHVKGPMPIMALQNHLEHSQYH